MNEENQQESYYTKEIYEEIRDMSEEEMYRELTNLPEKRVWYAILKYNEVRVSYAQSALNAGDPNKDATSMARNQGVMLGISDLPNAVITLTMEKREKRKEEELKVKNK